MHTEGLFYLFQLVDLALQICKESACVGAVHLCVVKLKRGWQRIAKQFLSILSPKQERIIKNTAVHAYNTVYFRLDNSRCADDHALSGQVPICAAICHLLRIQ